MQYNFAQSTMSDDNFLAYWDAWHACHPYVYPEDQLTAYNEAVNAGIVFG